MLERLVDSALRNRLLVLLLGLALIGGGVYTATRTPVDAFPDTTPVQVQINTVAPALNPEEIEQQLTLPVELAIGGLPRARPTCGRCRSSGSPRSLPPSRMERASSDARQYVSERLVDRGAAGRHRAARNSGRSPPAWARSSTTSCVPTTPAARSRSCAPFTIGWSSPSCGRCPALQRSIPGEATRSSTTWSSPPRRCSSTTSRSGTSSRRSRRTTRTSVGGVLTSGGQSQLVHGLGRVASIEQIENIVVSAFDGAPDPHSGRGPRGEGRPRDPPRRGHSERSRRGCPRACLHAHGRERPGRSPKSSKSGSWAFASRSPKT